MVHKITIGIVIIGSLLALIGCQPAMPGQTQPPNEPKAEIKQENSICTFSKAFTCVNYLMFGNNINLSIKNNIGHDVTGVTVKTNDCSTTNEHLILKDDTLTLTMNCTQGLPESDLSLMMNLSYRNPFTGKRGMVRGQIK